MTNLNRHPVYRDLRRQRTELRRQGLPITGSALAAGLARYSERGEDYVRDVQSIIRFNGLDAVDSARLSDS